MDGRNWQMAGQQVLGNEGQQAMSFSGRPFQSCEVIWDPVHARFSPCFLPTIAAIPAIVACIFLIIHLGRLLPLRRPKWTELFAKEYNESSEEFGVPQKRKESRSVIALLIISCTGLALQITSSLYPRYYEGGFFLAASWAVMISVILVRRPRTAQLGYMLVFLSIILSVIILLVDKIHGAHFRDIPLLLELICAICALTVLFRMPLRDPKTGFYGISPAFSSPTAELRSPEDSLTPWQYLSASWVRPLMRLAASRQLEREDIWNLPLEFQHQRLHDAFRDLKGSVVKRLLVANALDLLQMSILVLIQVVCDFSSPLLLQQLLRSIQNSSASKSASITYAFFLLILRLIAPAMWVFILWYGRRGYERSRGEMLTMLHEKTLRRKTMGSAKKVETEVSDDVEVKSSSFLTKVWQRMVRLVTAPFKPHETPNKQKKPDTAHQPAAMGKILNIMRNDVYEISQRLWDFDYVITYPLGLILSIFFLYRLLGWACFIGVITIIVAQLLTALISRFLLQWETKRRSATDAKLQKISQFVESIRHLRWYGWQNEWQNEILEARQQELNLKIVTNLLNLLIAFVGTLGSGMLPVVAFYAYTRLAGQRLTIDVAFPALQLFNLLDSNLSALPGLITAWLNAYIAMRRIEDFMAEPDREELGEVEISEDPYLVLNHASFAWPGFSDLVLRDVNISFPVGMTLVCGEVGSGKSALLQGLLSEIDLRGGSVHRPREMIGYTAQTAWLQNMSIRDNILFSLPFDNARYQQVMDVCALTPDMAEFKDGDRSEIGENGVGLSGGQKARVALARAVYSTSRILLLDDPIAALDHQTAELIVRKCIAGPLMKDRIVIFVTHRVDICRNFAKQIVEIKNGEASIIDRDDSELERLRLTRTTSTKHDGEEEPEEKAQVAKFMEDEKRATGDVKIKVYWEYIKSGKLRWWVAVIVLVTLHRLVTIAETWFLKQWGEGYDRHENVHSQGLFDDLPAPDDDIRPWLIGFILLALAQAIGYALSNGSIQVVVYYAGKRLFKRVMEQITHAKFRFYDVTPVGRLMNRLTSDFGTIDGSVGNTFATVAVSLVTWGASVIVISTATPVFLALSVCISAAFVYIFSKFMPASQNLRRLEMVSLTPLMANFGVLLEGLATVRAFCAEHRFQARVVDVIDTFQKMDHFYWSVQLWFIARSMSLAGISIFLITLLALYSNLSAGMIAFVLTASATFVESTNRLCRLYGKLQLDFVAVERVVELLEVEQEPKGDIDPPAWWPSLSGAIEFEDVTIRYAEHLDPSLENVSLTIPAGSSTAIIGRTGSGKSTLALSLLATVTASSGRILIDNIDISKVNTQALRHRITFLAQDPVLFPGSMRSNLDPMKEYTDDACLDVLHRITEGMRHQGWTLETEIETGGRNLSQGQRQLIGLARALLRRSPIVILDEATASIDMDTAQRIQDVLHDEMKGSTVITIAHRLEAVKNADYCVVLGQGKVNAQGTAEEILKRGHGGFGELLHT